MLKPTLLRTLQVDPAVHPRGQPHLSAASGLVQVQGRCYVVADDEHHLGYFKLHDASPVKLKRLFNDNLPIDPIKRKAAKPKSANKVDQNAEEIAPTVSHLLGEMTWLRFPFLKPASLRADAKGYSRAVPIPD